MAQAHVVNSASPITNGELNIISVSWAQESWSLDVRVGLPIAILISCAIILLLIWRLWPILRPSNVMEIDQADLGVGNTVISFRPNLTDRQVAYAIWVELSTRKIGLTINLDDDVITEIYDSWYNYFSVTRDLIKTVSVSKVRNPSTQQIINLSINVLNDGLRPHLTKWQARYRHWYDSQIERLDENADEGTVLDPQLIQQRFPKYDELREDLLAVNRRLIAYRASMQSLVFDAGK